jgi:DNA-binding MltR family transcriptional regulator
LARDLNDEGPMTSQPASIISLKRLVKRAPSSDDLHDLLLRLTTNLDDRGAALSAVSILDGTLQAAIIEKMRPEIKADPDYLFHSGAPLGSLSAKIRVGYALGLYDSESAEDLECIREIRNAFAHTVWDIKFTTDEVRAVSTRIKVMDRIEKSENDLEWDPTPRSRYLVSVSLYAFALHDVAINSSSLWTAFLRPKATT